MNWQVILVVGNGRQEVVDAAPYFRIFNPTTQQQKFDSEFKYIKKWIPEFDTTNYPEPIIDHKFARERALNRFKIGLKKI